MLKAVRNFSRVSRRIPPDSRPCAGVLLSHKLFEETGRLEEKDKIWKKELKPLEMKQKIKEMNFLPEVTEQSVASQANIQEAITCNTNNENTTGSEVQIVSGNTVAIQIDFQDINA